MRLSTGRRNAEWNGRQQYHPLDEENEDRNPLRLSVLSAPLRLFDPLSSVRIRLRLPCPHFYHTIPRVETPPCAYFKKQRA